MSERALPPARHEPRDLGVRFVLLLLAGICGVLLALVAVAYLIFPGQVKDDRFAGPFPSFPDPKPQPDPPLDWRVFHARQLATLNAAGWADRASGTVHIPIAQAMRAVAAEGIKDWPRDARASGGDRR